MEDDNQPVQTENPSQVIDVKTPDETPIIPTVEAAGDPPAGEEAPVPVQQTAPEPASSPEQPADIQTPADVPEPPHKAGAPIAAIIAAILVAIGLAAVTVYAYMKTQEDGKKTTSTSTQTDSSNAANEVDQTTKEIDSTLNSTSEATDFPEAEITDQSLGL